MQETWAQSLGWEDPLEKRMATHTNALALRISWTEESGRLQPMGLQRVRHDWATKHTCTREDQNLILMSTVEGKKKRTEKLKVKRGKTYTLLYGSARKVFAWLASHQSSRTTYERERERERERES